MQPHDCRVCGRKCTKECVTLGDKCATCKHQFNADDKYIQGYWWYGFHFCKVECVKQWAIDTCEDDLLKIILHADYLDNENK